MLVRLSSSKSTPDYLVYYSRINVALKRAVGFSKRQALSVLFGKKMASSRQFSWEEEQLGCLAEHLPEQW